MTKKSGAAPLLITDDEYFEALLPLLEQAKKEIKIIAYSFAIGSAAGKLNTRATPYQIAEKLVEIKERVGKKIRIQLYIEGARDTADRNLVTVRFLEKAGVEVHLGATHAKGFSIDGKVVLFGSTNLTQQSITKNYETNLLLSDPKTVREFNRYFEHLWEGGQHGEITLRSPLLADGDFKDVMIQLIDGAKKTLEFSIYFFDQKDIRDAFVRAHKRGVKVVGFAHHHEAFALSYVRRTRRTIEFLRSSGIENLFYAPATHFTHSKYLIVDRKELLLGTGNWLNEDVEIHPQLYIHLQDATIAKKLALHLGKQIRKAQS